MQWNRLVVLACILVPLLDACSDTVGTEQDYYKDYQEKLANNQEPIFASSLLTEIQHPENILFVGTFNASDPEGQDIRYTLAGDDKLLFTLDASSGDLYFRSPPNYEFGDNANRKFNVAIVASDPLESTQLNLHISLLDKNDPPYFTGESSFVVPENTTYVGEIVIYDEDNDSFTVSLTGADRDLFLYNSSTGQLSFINPQNYETNIDRTYSFTIQANDPLTSSKLDIKVKLIDQNDAPVIISTSFNIAENHTDIGLIDVNDEDNDKLQYYLNGANANLFTLDQQTGELRFVQAPDFEQLSNPTISIVVNVSDGIYEDTKTIDVAVTNEFDLDTRFNNDGVKQFNNVSLESAILLPDNGLILNTLKKTAPTIALRTIYKLNPQGELDTNFRNNGITNSEIGSIVVSENSGGYFSIQQRNPQTTVLRKFNANGSLDQQYGVNGVYDTQLVGGLSSRIGNLSDGSFILAWINNTDLQLLKFTPNGILDSSFGQNGVYTNSSLWIGTITSITATQDNGFIVVGKYADGGEGILTVWKFDATYNLDATFGNNGILSFDPPLNHFDYPFSSTISHDGGFVIVGEALGLYDSAIWKFDSAYNFVDIYSYDSFYPNIMLTKPLVITKLSKGYAVLGRTSFLDYTSSASIWKLDENFVPDTFFADNGMYSSLNMSIYLDPYVNPNFIFNYPDDSLVVVANIDNNSILITKFHQHIQSSENNHTQSRNFQKKTPTYDTGSPQTFN